MNQKLLSMLNDAEQALVREVEPKRLAKLDEDGLIDLHTRVRRARNKYTKLYRQRAGGQVGAKGRRSGASSSHAKTRAKAEIFEEVLSTVSRRLATVARASAAELKAERLAAAKGERTGAASKSTSKATKGASAKGSRSVKRGGDDSLRSPIRKKQAASSRAAKKRHQAARA